MDSFVKTNLQPGDPELTDSVTYWITTDMLQIRILEKEGFKISSKSLIHDTKCKLHYKVYRTNVLACFYGSSLRLV